MRGISRRQALTMLGGAAVLGACGGRADQPVATGSPAATGDVTVASFGDAATCALTPEQTEGPYYVDVDSLRSDIREDRAGTPLRIGARVLGADGCTPVRDAVFEIWHCDAEGTYSGFGAADPESRFLRGGQTTNADGIAVITTVYPGWYPGRTVHVHAKVALSNTAALTTQLYFDDAQTDEVYRAAPYRARPARDTRNESDGIYRAETTLKVVRDGDGYLGLVTIGVAA